MEMHVAHKVMHPVELLSTKLAFVWFDVGVDDHMSLESLFLDKTLEAHVTLVSPYVGVDEDVAFHVGQQGEFTTTDSTLVLFHPLVSERVLLQVV